MIPNPSGPAERRKNFAAIAAKKKCPSAGTAVAASKSARLVLKKTSGA
jgi:hypothetical protein